MLDFYKTEATARLSGVNTPTLSQWVFHSEPMLGIAPTRTGKGLNWFSLAQIKLLAAANALYLCGLPIRRALHIAMAFSHTADAHTNAGDNKVHVDRPAGGVHTNAMSLCIGLPGKAFGAVVAVDPGRPFISVWKELLGEHASIVIVDCDRVLNGVTDRLSAESE